jgi:hypothetical protein
MINQLQQSAQRRISQNLSFVTNQKYLEICGHHSNYGHEIGAGLSLIRGRLIKVYGLYISSAEYYRMKGKKIMHTNIGKFCKRYINSKFRNRVWIRGKGSFD